MGYIVEAVRFTLKGDIPFAAGCICTDESADECRRKLNALKDLDISSRDLVGIDFEIAAAVCGIFSDGGTGDSPVVAAGCSVHIGDVDIPDGMTTGGVLGDPNEDPVSSNDEAEPLNVYGQTKYEGEEAVRKYVPDRHFIVRIQWVYGKNGKNFVKTMLKLSETHDRLTVVDDQIGSPTYTPDIARIAVDMILSDKYGTYHVANTGLCSWYDFAKEIFRLSGKDVEVEPVDSSKYPAKAKRPHNSRMDLSKLSEEGFEELPTWQDALSRYLEEIDYTA